MAHFQSTLVCLFALFGTSASFAVGFVQEPSASKTLPSIGEAAWAASADAWAEPLVDDGLVMGLCIGVRQGEQVWVRGYGRRNAETEAKPDGATIYEIGSISKVFTGVLLATAVGEGRVRLDDPIQASLPEGVVLGERKQPVLFKHLSNHYSGWGRLPSNLDPGEGSMADPYADYTEEKLFEFLNGYRGARIAGKRYEYSNLAAGTLGVLLERTYASDYESLLALHITGPLKLESTRVRLPETRLALQAAPYDSALEPNAYWHFQALVGAGGIRSTVNDLLVFAAAGLHPPDNALGAALALSMQPTAKVDDNLSIGLGWHLFPNQGLVWHNGQTGGFHSYLSLCPEEDLAVVVLSNTAAGWVDALGANLMATLRGRETQPWTYEKAVPVPSERLQLLLGTYELAPGIDIVVTLNERGFFGQLTGQPVVRLYPTDESHFFLRVVDARLTFERDAEGRGTALTLHQNGLDQRAPRKDRTPQAE